MSQVKLSWKKKDNVRQTIHEDHTFTVKPKGDEYRVYLNDEPKSVFRGTLDLCKQYVENLVNEEHVKEQVQEESVIIDKYADFVYTYGRDWHLVRKDRKRLLKQAEITKEQITDHVVRVADIRVDQRLREQFRQHNLSKKRKVVAVLNGSLCLEAGDVPNRPFTGINEEVKEVKSEEVKKRKGPVERDRWGAKLGSGSAAINAVLTDKWKTAKTIQREAATERNVTSHLATLVREGKIRKKKSSKSGETIYKLKEE